MDETDESPVKRRQLAMLLEELEPLSEPQSALEQYATPPEVAADVLFLALGHGDLRGRAVADLGCGNGILGIGAARLGADRVVAVEVDPDAAAVARGNAARLGAAVDVRVQDVAAFQESVDTVLMNPPFGGQRKHADRPFLEAALRCAPRVYTFHRAVTRRWVHRRVTELGGRVVEGRTYKFPLPYLHPYHRKDVEEVDVDFYRIVREGP